MRIIATFLLARRLLTAGLLTGALVVTAVGTTVAATGDEVEQTVDAALEHMSLRSRVESIALMSGHGSGPPRYYIAWVTLKDCDGAVIINMNSTAALQGVSTVGDCQVPGLQG